jgi:hypothetical protein
VGISASTSVPIIPAQVQMPSLAIIETDRITVHVSKTIHISFAKPIEMPPNWLHTLQAAYQAVEASRFRIRNNHSESDGSYTGPGLLT